MEKSSAEIANQIAEQENELAKALDNQLIIEQEILLLQRNILELQIHKKDLEISNSNAKHLIKKLNIEISLLQKQFWKVKNSGL